MKLRAFIIIVVVAFTVVFFMRSPVKIGVSPLAGATGRLALSCDGNLHDRDDINSSAWELAMCAQAGRVADLVYFGYADHYWRSDPSWEADMTTSVTVAANDWGYSTSIIYNAHTNPDAAVNALSAAINTSSAANPLTIMEAGPAEIIGRALALSKSTNSGALKFVTIISHSTWNNTHAAQVGPSEGLTGITYSFNDFGSKNKALGANTIQLAFQQQLNDGPYSAYYWARDSADVRLQHLYEAGQRANKPAFDCSDSGMMFYCVTGVSNPSPAQVQNFFAGGNPTPTITPSPTSSPTPTSTPGVPSAPMNLAAMPDPLHPRHIGLTWTDNSTNETGFYIEQSTNGVSFKLVATTGAGVASYQLVGLNRQTTYYYRARAYNAAGKSAYTNVASATTP